MPCQHDQLGEVAAQTFRLAPGTWLKSRADRLAISIFWELKASSSKAHTTGRYFFTVARPTQPSHES